MARSKGIEGRIIALTFTGGSLSVGSDTFVHVRLSNGDVVKRSLPVEEWTALSVGSAYTIPEETR